MTTPSETLRRAASILREYAGAATPGPWTYNESFDLIEAQGERGTTFIADPEEEVENARWIALVSPELAPMLAGVMDAADLEYTADRGTVSVSALHALYLARAIVKKVDGDAR